MPRHGEKRELAMSNSTAAARPNIVFFMVDQLSARWFEAARDGACPTPNFDRLCARGVTFTNVITSNPVCQPARATIATGLTTRGHGVLENGYQLDPALPTFMQVLQRASWRTGALGKVHLRPHFAGLYPDYRPYGFDVTHITEDPRGGEWLDWVEAERPEHYEEALATIWATKIPDFAAYGPRKVNLRDRVEEIRREFDWRTPEFPENTFMAYTLPFPEEVSQTHWITAHAIDFIRSTPADQPFCAHVGYVQPHSPFNAPAAYARLVNLDRIPSPAPAEWLAEPSAPGFFEKFRKRVEGVDLPRRWRHARRMYFADISYLDSRLGCVMETLEQTGRLEDTYVIFLSDHGEMLGDHGFSGKEDKHYDACIRVPLVIAGPGVKPGLVCDEMVQLEDICPTVMEMTGQMLPEMPKTGPYLNIAPKDIPILPGRSLLPLCRAEKVRDWRSAAYCESYNRIDSNDPGDWARTIRTKDFRYTFYPRNGEQMFHLAQDPCEQRNIVADPAHAQLRQRLRDELLEMMVMQDYPKTRRELFALGVH